MLALAYCLRKIYTFSTPPPPPHPTPTPPLSNYFRKHHQHFIGKACTYLFMLQIRPTGNSYFQFQKRWRMTITNYCREIPKREKQKFNNFSLKSSRVTQGVAENIQCVIDADFMTLELYYNTELGAEKRPNSALDLRRQCTSSMC